MELNLRGPLSCARPVLPGMLALGHGRIVNVSTTSGFAATPMLSAYAVSKPRYTGSAQTSRRRPADTGDGLHNHS
ncbi:MAG: SDR family NAD(P)-dependent oxidoreductase [Micromonosporaceae bacterium]